MESVLIVKKNSPADKAGIKIGDKIKGFDGYIYTDVLDFIYYDGATSFTIQLVDENGEEREVKIKKRSSTPLGIEISDKGFSIRPCHNRCTFCFVEQCPKGMRDTLYVKDDDYRLSFTCGSYITLTNLTENDIERIIRLKLSPLYISVHAFNPQVKVGLCANPRSAETFDIMKRFANAGITMHTQIVMVEGVNSDDILKETITELYKLYPFVATVAVVPVGLTGHREGLTPLTPVSLECGKRTIDFCENFNKSIEKKVPQGFVWCSDEMYILAKKELPPYEYYGDFSQIENGVGLVATFLHDLQDELTYYEKLIGEYTLVTGVSFYPTLKRVADNLTEIYDIKLDVIQVENDFFGHTVTVTGLLTGGDIIAKLKDKLKYKNVILPRNVFKEFTDVMLDGISKEDIEKELDCHVFISNGGDGLIRLLAGEEDE